MAEILAHILGFRMRELVASYKSRVIPLTRIYKSQKSHLSFPVCDHAVCQVRSVPGWHGQPHGNEVVHKAFVLITYKSDMRVNATKCEMLCATKLPTETFTCLG